MSGMRYQSTRGGVRGASFEDVVLGGLAPDKGLYVPEMIPSVDPAEIESVSAVRKEEKEKKGLGIQVH